MYRKFQTSSSPPKRSKTRAPFPPHHSGLPRKLDTSHPFGTRQPSSVIILPNGHIVSRACPVKLNASRGSKNYARFNSSEEKRRIIIISFASHVHYWANLNICVWRFTIIIINQFEFERRNFIRLLYCLLFAGNDGRERMTATERKTKRDWTVEEILSLLPSVIRQGRFLLLLIGGNNSSEHLSATRTPRARNITNTVKRISFETNVTKR